MTDLAPACRDPDLSERQFVAASGPVRIFRSVRPRRRRRRVVVPHTGAFISSGVSGGADAVRATVQAFADIGADELVFNPTSDDIDEVARLADVVL
ncbi:hypothetical protein IM697_24475 [Streptomyces ferrugineus]|uniref:Uncharacterized protein n=1 Tax=Streptomyces ferrugineus TaxID=1413221 RepID=A0A7M2SC94_9ACTN|nr:hypothetical protein [Streptomyces ferrugineus]QOV33375.1 hypothetical protein IM697_24475 [Streptomyces ferrugineus]